MTGLIPRRRYRVVVEGVSNEYGSYVLLTDGSFAIRSDWLDEHRDDPGVSIELLPEPLPTTPGSVVLEDKDRAGGRAWQLLGTGWWRMAYTSDPLTGEELLASGHGPFTVLFDAGADL